MALYEKGNRIFLYVGTYTKTSGQPVERDGGIYVYEMDRSNGDLALVQTVSGVSNPSFLAIHPTGRYLYSVSEVRENDVRSRGALYSYAIDKMTGMLTPINSQATIGVGPCHVAIDHSGQIAIAANYFSGSVASFPINADGSLEPASSFFQHEGSSVMPGRQDGPHAHSVTLSPDNRFAFVCDLGLDQIKLYRVDTDGKKIVPHSEPFVKARPGSGPRHVEFHPNGRWMFVIHELDSTLSAFSWERESSSLRERWTVSTLPDGWKGDSATADVHVLPTGSFVYGSNRGHDSLAIYSIEEATGRLTLQGFQPTGGKTPRNFGIPPLEASAHPFLYAANQGTDDIHTFRIDLQTGKLTPTGQVTSTPSPVCLKFLRLG